MKPHELSRRLATATSSTPPAKPAPGAHVAPPPPVSPAAPVAVRRVTPPPRPPVPMWAPPPKPVPLEHASEDDEPFYRKAFGAQTAEAGEPTGEERELEELKRMFDSAPVVILGETFPSAFLEETLDEVASLVERLTNLEKAKRALQSLQSLPADSPPMASGAFWGVLTSWMEEAQIDLTAADALEQLDNALTRFADEVRGQLEITNNWASEKVREAKLDCARLSDIVAERRRQRELAAALRVVVAEELERRLGTNYGEVGDEQTWTLYADVRGLQGLVDGLPKRIRWASFLDWNRWIAILLTLSCFLAGAIFWNWIDQPQDMQPQLQELTRELAAARADNVNLAGINNRFRVFLVDQGAQTLVTAFDEKEKTAAAQ